MQYTQISESQSCPICYSSNSDDTTLTQIPSCNHTFCKDCLTQYLEIQISSLKVSKISCPDQDCLCILEESFIQTLLPETSFNRYKTLLSNKQASTSLFCPHPGCSKIINPQENSPFTPCSCGSQVCNTCGNLWHEGKSCLQAIDPDFEVYARENNLRFCMMCKTTVARVEGCTHITCPICDYEWCWLCGQEYSNLHDTKCEREWNPKPPAKIVKENLPKDFRSRTTRMIKNLPKMLMIFVLKEFFWPFFLMNIFEEMRNPEHTLGKKIKWFLIAFFMNIAYLADAGVVVWLIGSYPENRDFLLGCLVFVGMSPWFGEVILHYMTLKYFKKRWHQRDPNAFGYTDAHKPSAADVENQNIPVEKEFVTIQIDDHDEIDIEIAI